MGKWVYKWLSETLEFWRIRASSTGKLGVEKRESGFVVTFKEKFINTALNFLFGNKMFGKLFGNSIPKIESLDDLQDERARTLAEQHQLDVREILPKYLELEEEVRANQGQLEIDPDDSSTPLNVHDGYRKKLACDAVICYEFSKRESLKFPVLERAGAFGVGQRAFLASVEVKGNVHRTAPVQTYEQIGAYYEQVIGILDQHQRQTLDRRLGA